MSQQRLMQECFEQSYSQEWEKAGDHDRSVWEAAWWASRAVLEKEAKATAQGVNAKMLEALEHARLFIRNGIELGYILMPDADTPDPAHDTRPMIEAAIAAARQEGGAA